MCFGPVKEKKKEERYKGRRRGSELHRVRRRRTKSRGVKVGKRDIWRLRLVETSAEREESSSSTSPEMLELSGGAGEK